MSDKVYTLQELAERWSCSMGTIYSVINSKKLRTFRVGRQLRVTAEEVARYENGQTA